MKNVKRWPLFIATFAAAGLAVAADDFGRLYSHMIEANKAQVVMLYEEELISGDLARQLAVALREVESEPVPAAGERRYPNYLDLETALKARVGDEASNIHLGRSRNDLGATMNLMLMRRQVLELVTDIVGIRQRLHEMASQHVDTVMPGYTHGVQAQPTTLAHFLNAFDAGLHRDVSRLQAVYRRINRSPLGAGAYTTSGFALDRERLAGLLGFPALVDNSYDAIVVGSMDTKVELASALSISALGVGRFAQYVLFQYDDPAPGLVISESVASRSSIMPQKRNPSAVERLRVACSEVVGRAHTSALLAHNTPLYEVKDVRQDHTFRLNDLVFAARDVYRRLDLVLRSLTIRPELLLAQVDADFSTMTELADTLKRDADVPFRVGYEVASDLTTYGRSIGKAPAELTFEEVDRIYRAVTGEALPLGEDQLRRVFDAREFVESRKGAGGPQPASVAELLAAQADQTSAQRQWVDDETARLRAASDELESEFAKLVRQGAAR